MKKQVTKQVFWTVFGVASLFMASCSSNIKEIYKGPEVKADTNPLANLTPSSDFSWSTMQHSTVTIEVNDLFNSEYNYYVALYATNPTGKDVDALFSGVARGNAPLTHDVDLPTSASNIYVKVTDPKGYVMVYGYAAPEAGQSVTLPCVIGEEAHGTTKAVATKMVASNDFSIPEAEEAPAMDWTIPADAETLPDADRYQITKNYVVPANTTVTFTGNRNFQPLNGERVRIYVAGTLDIQENCLTILNNTELYVLNGGKVTGNKIVPQEGAIIAVQDGGEASLHEIQSAGSSAYLYVAGTMYVSNKLSLNQGDVNTYIAPTGQIIGAAKGSQALEDKEYTLEFNSSQGQFYIDSNEQSSGQFLCKTVKNEVGSAQIVVAENARMIVNETVQFQCPIYNAGLFSADILDGGKVRTAKIYNMCTMIVKSKIQNVHDTYLKHGTLSGGVTVDNDKLSFSPVPLFIYDDEWDVNIYLMNGSYMDVQDITIAKAFVYGFGVADGSATSLLRMRGTIKTKPVSWGAGLRCSQNVVAEYDSANFDGGSGVATESGAASADLNTTVIDLETCTGNVSGREDNPSDPIVQPDPYEGEVQAAYTVNFEDQWPVVGDYDVNDIVLHVKKIATLQTSTKVTKATFTIDLMAVGASYTLGAGLQLDHITNADIASVVYSQAGKPGMMNSDQGAFTLNGAGVEAGNSTDPAILPICYDAHKAYLNQTIVNYNPLNTNSSRSAGREMTITVTFADGANVSPDDLMVSALNFFIFRPKDEIQLNKGERVEIHLKGYAPTRDASDYYFGQGNDASTSGNYYVTTDGFPWGIVVNDVEENATDNVAWAWPTESKLITKEYTKFTHWVNSNGKEDKDWMIK